jgi:hypothetical protein
MFTVIYTYIGGKAMSMSTFQIEKKEQKRHKKKTDSDGG